MIVAGYVIAYAVLLIGGARLGDRFTQRRTFIAGLVVFTLASLACGSAWNEQSLIVFRFAQGVGAAAMAPQVMTLIQRTFTGAARARALSIYAAIVSGGLLAGEILGGLIVDANLGGLGLVTLTATVLLLVVPLVLGESSDFRCGRGCASRRACWGWSCSCWSSGRWPGVVEIRCSAWVTGLPSAP
ncbi:MFS transporter [Nocardia salmonicida]|uniref:MFS transporter n=1 Tax=Nocardia salmonicida TaxID=53431 RepID=UPI003408F7DC